MSKVFRTYAAAAAACVLSSIAHAEVDAEECRQALRSDTGDVLRCALSYEARGAERERLVQATSGVITGLNCGTRMRVSKGDIFASLLAGGTVRVAPQRIDCTLQTNRDSATIGLVVAPSFRLNGDRVADARVNLSEVDGLPPFMARMLRDHVNSDEGVSRALASALQGVLDDL